MNLNPSDNRATLHNAASNTLATARIAYDNAQIALARAKEALDAAQVTFDAVCAAIKDNKIQP